MVEAVRQSRRGVRGLGVRFPWSGLAAVSLQVKIEVTPTRGVPAAAVTTNRFDSRPSSRDLGCPNSRGCFYTSAAILRTDDTPWIDEIE